MIDHLLRTDLVWGRARRDRELVKVLMSLIVVGAKLLERTRRMVEVL